MKGRKIGCVGVFGFFLLALLPFLVSAGGGGQYMVNVMPLGCGGQY